MAQITCKNLNVGYESKTVIENLSFTINNGDYLCIIGENGAGKSTLMKTLLGLKKPNSGSIILGDGLLSTEFGYLTQQSDIQRDFPASVKEIVLSGCQSRCGLRPYYTKEEKELASQAMEQMDITNFSKRCYRELSGGQQQRVLLARALCATQKILFLDEPVSGLDPTVSAELYEVIENLHKNYNITIVMISHDVLTAIDKATHVLYLGKNNFYGTKEEYLKSSYTHLLETRGNE